MIEDSLWAEKERLSRELKELRQLNGRLKEERNGAVAKAEAALTKKRRSEAKWTKVRRDMQVDLKVMASLLKSAKKRVAELEAQFE